jgi:hypothetical protein
METTMKLEIEPKVGAILEAQVAAGLFGTVEEALRAAVLGVPMAVPAGHDLSWMQPLLDAADRDIEAGDTIDADEAFDAILQRLSNR